MMRIAHVSFNEQSGGAAIAAHRLHCALRRHNVDSRMVVLRKSSADPHTDPVKLTRIQKAIRRRTVQNLERPSTRRYPNYDGSPWSNARATTPVLRKLDDLKVDVVHLHWIGDGLLSLADISRIDRPTVWTLHDMWAFTGGCHYTDGCTHFHEQCGRCPILGSTRPDDLSQRNWSRKHRHWPQLDLTVVTPSEWLAEQVNRSALMQRCRTVVIANGIDRRVFRPHPSAFARDVLNLPQDRKLVLFGAYQLADKRKGMHYLVDALHVLESQHDVDLVTFGNGDIRIEAHRMGHLADERLLALLYSAVDAFVAPSVQDNLPNTVLEALACGTPCVAFDIGGMPDMITHRQNGYLADPFDVQDLAQGMLWALDITEPVSLASQFDASHMVDQYLRLYQELLAK